MKLHLQYFVSSFFLLTISTLSLFSAQCDFQGSQIEYVTSEVETPCSGCITVFDCIDFQHTSCLKAMLHRDATVKHFMKGYHAVTPLIDAVSKRYEEGVATLISAKASVDVPDSAGRTPLMYAVKYGYENIVTTLLHEDVDLYKEDGNGHTALDRAIIEGQLGCVVKVLQAFYEEEKDPLVRAVIILRSAFQISYSKWLENLANQKVELAGDSNECEWADNLKAFLKFLYESCLELTRYCGGLRNIKNILLYENDEWYGFCAVLVANPERAYYKTLKEVIKVLKSRMIEIV